MAIYNKDIYLLSATGLQNGVHDGYWEHIDNPDMTEIFLNNNDPDNKDFKDGDELHIHFAVKPQSLANFIKPANVVGFGIAYFYLDISGNKRNLSMRIPKAQDFLDALAHGKVVDVTTTLNEVSSGLFTGPASATTFTISDNPRKVKINGKGVKSISIGGHRLTDLTLNSHVYSFANNVSITKAEVQSFVNTHTTWVGDVATIDTSAKLKGLVVEYSKSSGLADGDTIDVTIKHDSSFSDTLNGGTVDITYVGIDIINPTIVLTDAQIHSGIQGAITWNGKVGRLDVSKWPYLGTTLYAANPQVHDGVSVRWRVAAATGFTINGAHGYNFDYAPLAAKANSDDWYSFLGTDVYKNGIQIYTLPDTPNNIIVGSDGNVYTSMSSGRVYKNQTLLYQLSGRNLLTMVLDKDNNIYTQMQNNFDSTIYKNGVKLYDFTSSETCSMALIEDGSLHIALYGVIYKDGVAIATGGPTSTSTGIFDKLGTYFNGQYGGRVYDWEGHPVTNTFVGNTSKSAAYAIGSDDKIYCGERLVAVDLDNNYYSVRYFDTALLKNDVVVDTKGNRFEYIAPATEYGGRTGIW